MKELIYLRCEECNIDYIITGNAIKYRIKHQVPNLCKNCQNKRKSQLIEDDLFERYPVTCPRCLRVREVPLSRKNAYETRYSKLCKYCRKSKTNRGKLFKLICGRCNTEYEISYTPFIKRKNKILPNLCHICLIIFNRENKKEKYGPTKSEKYNKWAKEYNRHICGNCKSDYQITNAAMQTRRQDNIPNLCHECMRERLRQITIQDRKEFYEFKKKRDDKINGL